MNTSCFTKSLLIVFLFICTNDISLASDSSGYQEIALPRKKISMDFDWRFALGHAYDSSKDFDHGVGFFSYFAKTGNGDGAAAFDFDDSSWRKLDLPHDWAVELPFDQRASQSHGYKAIGRSFPENSIGWYRKTFDIPATDLGKRISVEFDGVFRNSNVWINGHYLGTELSGYSSFAYNLTEYLNYGGKNVIAVRVDATMEEGWFYEGAGIYRHVWLVKTEPLHIAQNGTFVFSEVNDGNAEVTAQVTVLNDNDDLAICDITHTIVDADDNVVGSSYISSVKLNAGDSDIYTSEIKILEPMLWSIDTPYMYKLVTTISSGNELVDSYTTPFGIRTIRFDPDNGFFLNGKHIKLHGTNNHQDHAGVGAAIPDALQEFRIKQLKDFGVNLYRCSHNPPTPELLDACDRLGMLVIDENRLMGVTDYHYDHLKRLILRDRNHPSVILWSLGNEEWRIEGSSQGTRIASSMHKFVGSLDPTRPTTVASSGFWGQGNSIPVDVMGFNYYVHGDTDLYHSQNPDKPTIGTEECASFTTRGVYVENADRAHSVAYDKSAPDWGALAQKGWKHHAERSYISGVCIWTGFDYRGEPTPYTWPAISSQFGILDLCGFRKDNAYYYMSWWTDDTVLHVFPHWNWQGKEGETINVWCYSNCDQVELFLNDVSLGLKNMEKNSHLEWDVKYQSGTLLAKGYKNGIEVALKKLETTGQPQSVSLKADRNRINADGQDVSVVTVQVVDKQGRPVPVADNMVTFSISGPGRIIGVGNGDPSCHEPDKYFGDDADNWKRSLFNGLAQVIVQSTKEPGVMILAASSSGLDLAEFRISTITE